MAHLAETGKLSLEDIREMEGLISDRKTSRGKRALRKTRRPKHKRSDEIGLGLVDSSEFQQMVIRL